MDGSSAPFVSLLYTAGRDAQVAVRRPALRVLEPIRVGDEHRWIQLLPAAEFRISYTLDHEHPAVGVQVASFVPTERVFVEELAPARTYGFLKDLELLRQQGLALGGSLDNAVVLGQERILNGTLRFQDEFVRHKILDVIGDLTLVGAPRAGPRRRPERRARAEPPPGAGAGEDGATVGECGPAAAPAPGRGALGRRGPATHPRRRPLTRGPPDRFVPHRRAAAAPAARGYNALLCPGGAGRPGSWRSRWGSCSWRALRLGAPAPFRISNLVVTNSDSTLLVTLVLLGAMPDGIVEGLGTGIPASRPLPGRAVAVQLLVGGPPGGGQARGAPSRLRCPDEGVPGRRRSRARSGSPTSRVTSGRPSGCCRSSGPSS